MASALIFVIIQREIWILPLKLHNPRGKIKKFLRFEKSKNH